MAVFPLGLPGAMKSVVTPRVSNHSMTILALNSDPLSDRRYSGVQNKPSQVIQMERLVPIVALKWWIKIHANGLNGWGSPLFYLHCFP
jgi:hypothetical protein